MKTTIKKFVLASFVLIVGVISFTPTAKAGSIVSLSISERWGGDYDVKRVHYYDRLDRKAMRHHKREMRRAYKRARRAALYRANWNSYSSGSYIAAHHTPPVVYQSVTVVPIPISYQPAPMLANQASASYLSNGQTCREYQTEIVINGRAEQVYGTACLQSDGAWRIVE